MGLFTKNYPPEIAPRIPPGQRLVKTWPVLHYGPIPSFDGANWDLEVSGLVEQPFRLTLRGAAGPAHGDGRRRHALRHRLDDPRQHVGRRARSGTIVERAQPTPEAKWVIAECAYGYTSDLSLEAMSDDDVLLAWRNHGEDLTPEHGWPLRLVVPKRYAWKSAKWLTGLRFSDRERAGLLGGARLPRARGAVRRGALQLPGGPEGRARALSRTGSGPHSRNSWIVSP